MNQYATNAFIERLKRDVMGNAPLSICDYMQYKENRKEELKQILKLEELGHYSAEITYRKEEKRQADGVSIVKYFIRIAEDLSMPLYTIKSGSANGKNIVFLHGHDVDGAYEIWSRNERGELYQKNILLRLAEAGFMVIVPELVGYGEAIYEYLLKGKPTKGKTDFHYGYLSVLGYDLTGIRVWQVMRTIDFLEKLGLTPDVLFGFSGGGLLCELVGAIDERIQNMIVSSHANTYEDGILSKEQSIDNYVHGIGRIGNSYEVLALAAPKNMLLLNGTLERPFPVDGAKKAYAYLEEIYKSYGAEDKLQTYLFEGRHEINGNLVLAWLEQFQ